MPTALFALAVMSVTLNALAQITLRKAMISNQELPSALSQLFGFAIAILLNPWFVAGIACYLVSIGLWLIVLSKTQVSLAYPLLSIGYIITAVIGYYWLNENVNLLRIGGIGFICIGIVFVSRSA